MRTAGWWWLTQRGWSAVTSIALAALAPSRRARNPRVEREGGRAGRSGGGGSEALQVRLPSEERGSFTDLFSVGEWERWEGKVSK